MTRETKIGKIKKIFIIAVALIIIAFLIFYPGLFLLLQFILLKRSLTRSTPIMGSHLSIL